MVVDYKRAVVVVDRRVVVVEVVVEVGLAASRQYPPGQHPPGQLPGHGSCPGGSCQARNLSGGHLSPWNLSIELLFPPGFCPGGSWNLELVRETLSGLELVGSKYTMQIYILKM